MDDSATIQQAVKKSAGEVMQNIITPDFVAFLEDQFMLDWKGVHGVSH